MASAATHPATTEQRMLADGVNPIAAYSQSLAANNVRLIKVDDTTPVWAQSQTDPQAAARQQTPATLVLPSRAAGPDDVNGESTRYDHVKSRIKSKVMRNNPASDNPHGLQLDLGPGFGVSMLDNQQEDHAHEDDDDAYTSSMPNSASKAARANGLAYGPGSDLGTPDLTQSESRPSLSSASTTETSNSKSNTHAVGLNDDAKGKDRNDGRETLANDSPYDQKAQLGAATADGREDGPGIALSDLPSPVSSTSSGAPIATRSPKKGARDGIFINTANEASSSSPATAGDGISAVVIPPTPPTTTSTTASNNNDYSTPVKTSPRPPNNSLLAPGSQQQQSSPGKQKAPALHTRSLSFQTPTASTSSSSPSLSASTGSFPVRRSSLFPPTSPSAYTSALPESSSGAGLRNKRGSLSPQPRRTLSFRGAFSPGSSSHPLQQEVFYDEPISLEQQAEQQRQTEELEDSIARQAEQIRKERASKRQENERQQVKAALLQHQQQQQPPLAPLRIDTSGSVPKESKGKERERDRLESNTPQAASSSKPLPNIQQEIDKQASPVTPTSPTGYLWNSPVAGEHALVRSPVEGHFPSPTTANGQLSTSQGPGGAAARQGSAPVLVGNLIGEDHVNYILMYNMLTGIRIGVSRCEAKIQRPLTDEDYKAAHKFSFDIVGNELTPSARYDFKFKDYAPWVFRELRGYFHLDPADYLLSLTAKYILSELGSPGKSGSFFYFSRDYRFIIKTISHTEHKFLRKILKNYHQHVIDNPHTLISRFYGLHRVKLPRGRKIHFVIMNNLFPPHRDIHETFDLKGSSIGREYPEEKAKEKPRATLKDLNWIHRGRQLEFGPQKRQLFEEQLKRDVVFLQAMHIMDYSLLVGIHDLRRGNSENLRDGLLTVFQPEQGKLRRRPTIRGDLERQHEASELRKAVQRSDPKALRNSKLPDKDRSERRHFVFYQDEGGLRATNEWDKDENTIYYLGVIDILTPYNLYKRTEHFFRSFKYDQHRISAVPPEEYGNRFLDFLLSVVRGGDVSRRPKME